MSRETFRLGNVAGMTFETTTVGDSAIETTTTIKAGAPVVANDVLILGSMTTLNIVTSVANITDHAIVRGAGGVKGIQDSALTINDDGDITVPDDFWMGIGAALERVVFDAAGYISFMGCNVGIGTVAPGYLLHLRHDTNPTLVIQDNTNDCLAFLQAADTIARTGSASAHDFRIQSNSTDRIWVASGGVVSIGGAVANAVTIATDGQLTLTGTAKVTKEVKLTAASFAPGASGATQTSIFGRYSGWAFTINDDMITSFEIPFDWDPATNLEIKIYWYIDEAYATNSGEVQWEVNWAATPSGNTEAIDAPTHSGTIDYGDQDIPANAKYLTKSAAGTIAAASLAAGDLIGINVVRKVLDGGANPAAEPVMVHLEVEYTSNKLGEAT